MAGHADFYRSLVQFYPKAFRGDFGDDLVQSFSDLLARDGPSRTWRRTAVDLAVTVPRYRLETLMNPRNTNTTLYIITVVLALAAVTSITTDLFVGGFILLAGAVVFAVASSSRLARSTRPADPQRRRRMLRTAAGLAVTCVVSTSVFWIELSSSGDWNGGKLVAYNAVFFVTAIGALGCLIAGLRTQRTVRQPAAS